MVSLIRLSNKWIAVSTSILSGQTAFTRILTRSNASRRYLAKSNFFTIVVDTLTTAVDYR